MEDPELDSAWYSAASADDNRVVFQNWHMQGVNNRKRVESLGR